MGATDPPGVGATLAEGDPLAAGDELAAEVPVGEADGDTTADGVAAGVTLADAVAEADMDGAAFVAGGVLGADVAGAEVAGEVTGADAACPESRYGPIRPGSSGCSSRHMIIPSLAQSMGRWRVRYHRGCTYDGCEGRVVRRGVWGKLRGAAAWGMVRKISGRLG